MKVLICSDSHGKLDYFQDVMELEQPEIVIFAGDHSVDALNISLMHHKIPFAYVRGNTDYDDDDAKDVRIFDLMGRKVFLTHGHLYGVKTNLNELEKKAREEIADICIFGHTHREYLVEKDGTVYVNPGALQDKKYVIYDGRDFIQKVLD